MPIFEIQTNAMVRLQETSFAAEKISERGDLQRLLRANISILDSDLMVLSEEFSNWEDSSRRIDLLCLNKQAQLVVVELKRTEDGGHMELQALRYAAMISSMTFDQMVQAHATLLGGENSQNRAEEAILEFLDWESKDEGSLASEIKIILASCDFSTELTTSVLWLNKRDLDITCFRLKPYRLDQRLLVDVQQIIPLPEAADYEITLRTKDQEIKRVASSKQDRNRKFWAQLIERSKAKTQVAAGRSTTKDHWLSCGIGRTGFRLSFIILRDEARVEFGMNFGDEKEKTLKAFRAFQAQKEQIEAEFGDALEWLELPGKNDSRIQKTLTCGGIDTSEATWPDIQDQMIDAMIRLEKSFKTRVKNLAL